MSYTIIAKYPPNAVGAVWWHIKVEDKYYIVSATSVHSRPETFVFESNEACEWINSSEVVGCGGIFDHNLAIAELLEQLEAGDDEDQEDDETSNKISEREALERFDESLNECWETVHICGYDYDPAQALKQCDEVAYREEFNNWLDSEGLELE